MKVTLTVSSGVNNYRFVARVHRHSSSRQFFLDPRKFYKRWGKKIPRRHHEIEILNPVTRVLRRKPLHVHKSEKRRRLFVCYPLAIPTVEKAVEIFRVWCAGVVLTWDHSVDLNTVHEGECKRDNTKFFNVLERRYGVSVGEPILN